MKNKLLIMPGYLVGIGSLFIITYRTILAFLSGTQSITLYINRYGEQYTDIIFLVIIWIICLMGLGYLYKTIKEEKTTNSIDNN